MKKILPFFMLMIIACNKEQSIESKINSVSNTNTLSGSTLIVNGTLDLQTTGVNVASLAVVNHRSSYELCGTAGTDLLWPVNLPLSDSSGFPGSILTDGDSLSADVYLDTTVRKNYIVNIVVLENNISINNQQAVNNQKIQYPYLITKNFIFHNASKYKISATVQ